MEHYLKKPHQMLLARNLKHFAEMRKKIWNSTSIVFKETKFKYVFFKIVQEKEKLHFERGNWQTAYCVERRWCIFLDQWNLDHLKGKIRRQIKDLYFLEQRGLTFRETARGQKLVLFALHISPPFLPFFSAEFSSFFNIFYLVS
jgi:hypothetical protein